LSDSIKLTSQQNTLFARL